MTEGPPNPLNYNEEELKWAQMFGLSIELSQRQEAFPFPGIDLEAYAKLKADEERDGTDFTTPIDELIERFRREGLKVVLAKYPSSGNFFVLPAESDDVVSDSLLPRHLLADGADDEKLKRFISVHKSLQ